MTPTWAVPPRGWREALELDRRKMTVCIAATCEVSTADPKIIMCTDWQIISHLGSAETAHKQTIIHPRGWFCLWSGFPYAARALIGKLRQNFSTLENFEVEATVKATVNKSLNELKWDLCDQYTNGKFGMPYKDFLTNGKNWLPETRHALAV